MMRFKLCLLLGALFLVLGCSKAKYGAPAVNGYYDSARQGLGKAEYNPLAFEGSSSAEQEILSENDLERKIVMTAVVYLQSSTAKRTMRS